MQKAEHYKKQVKSSKLPRAARSESRCLVISIVVPSIRSSTVADTIAAVLEQSDPDWELIIADQSRTEALVSLLAQYADPRIRRVACPGRGAALARNFGVLHASRDLIAFTDDDCRPRRDWVAVMREIFQDPEVWMATGSLVAPPISLRGLYAGADYVPPERRARPSEQGERIYSVTANAVYRKTAFERAGPFDVCFSPGTELFGGEEDDHGCRMELFDPVLVQTPRLEVEHTHGVRFGFKAVWDLRRKYAISTGALAAKQTLLRGDGKRLAWQETKTALAGLPRRSPLTTCRSVSRAWFVWQGYYRVLRNYTVDQELRLLVPRGTSLQQVYQDIPALVDYRLPSGSSSSGPKVI